jgi:hypothetical protein
MSLVVPYSSVNREFVQPAFVEAARELENKFVLD